MRNCYRAYYSTTLPQNALSAHFRAGNFFLRRDQLTRTEENSAAGQGKLDFQKSM